MTEPTELTKLTGRLARWDGHAPDLRGWTDAEILDGLAQLGVQTNREQFTQLAEKQNQSDLEEAWLHTSGVTDDGLQVFVWLSVRELWQRWNLPFWPRDRLARMLAYLIDSDFAAEYADQLHAPSAIEVFDALEAWLEKQSVPREALESLVAELGMPPEAWPGKMLEAMAEWSEVGNVTLAERGGAFLTRMLGHGHAQAYLATALVSARLMDHAMTAALQVPMEATLRGGFEELVGHLCLAGGDRMLADYWLHKSELQDGTQASERTYAAETLHTYLADWRRDGKQETEPVTDHVKAAARQAAAQSAYYAWMAFAGTAQGAE